MQGTEHSVVRAVLVGDKEAYGALVRAHSAAVFRVVFRIIGNEADAEEIVQETFLRAYQGLESFQQRSGFGTWLYRIAVNCALNRISHLGITAEFRHGEESDPEEKTVQGSIGRCRLPNGCRRTAVNMTDWVSADESVACICREAASFKSACLE
jgi:RNA polymerase sigma-70 factor, ECF subfamily